MRASQQLFHFIQLFRLRSVQIADALTVYHSSCDAGSQLPDLITGEPCPLGSFHKFVTMNGNSEIRAVRERIIRIEVELLQNFDCLLSDRYISEVYFGMIDGDGFIDGLARDIR